MSRVELDRLGFHFKNSGLEFVVVGGWAVYSYNDYMESQDIDIVCDSRRILEAQQILEERCG